MCKVWQKFEEYFWSRRFLHFVNVFSLLHKYLLSEMPHHLNKSSLPKDVLCKTRKCEEFAESRTDVQTGGRTDERRRTGNQKGSLDLSDQVR